MISIPSLSCGTALLSLWLAATASAGVTPDQKVNPRARALAEFNKRVERYVEVHKKVDGEVPSLKKTDDPAEISSREKALGEGIRAARAGAKQGDIFAPGVSRQFTRIIQKDLRSRQPRDQRAALEEVPTGYKVRVNDFYPTTEPLATVPPLLLAKLQRLPDQLEYRFLGRHLILRDVKANLIVDYIPNAIPAPAA